MQFIIRILLQAIEIYSYILLAYVFMSWVPSLYETSLGRLIIWLVRPILKPFQRFHLQFMGLDWTVFLVMILLNLFARFLVRLFLSI
ncbi:YggT family protein [Streptococcus sp. X16XC17]|uniref:YggT family protein n=1 Tax=unclassified Streptococcus TaxID=2608887 RepID=UPI00066FCB0B|nr:MULTISPECIES: YggT family protein [unclassified Streptococcus]TCD45992.1 YggT family protein [Streptococcus sp. X16XC17]